MNTGINKDALAAFVDGELPPKEMERIAALLAEHPNLESYVRRQERLRTDLQAAFTDVLDEPVPIRLIQSAHSAPVSLRWRLRQMLQRMSWLTLVPAGAALAVGWGIGALLHPGVDFTSTASGQLIAQGSLSQALDRQLASELPPGAGPHIGISFRDKAGEDCRTFFDGASRGLACHRNDAWIIGTLVNEAPESPRAIYRMAGSEMPPAVRNAVVESIVGAPFDAQAERAARDSDWK